MASISKQSNGRRTIQFAWTKYKRRSIRLGKVSQRFAEGIKYRVEQLNAARITGQAIDPDTARWVVDLDDVMVEKLARAGLIPKRERATLRAFLDSYIATRTDVKKSAHTRRVVVKNGKVVVDEETRDGEPVKRVNPVKPVRPVRRKAGADVDGSFDDLDLFDRRRPDGLGRDRIRKLERRRRDAERKSTPKGAVEKKRKAGGRPVRPVR